MAVTIYDIAKKTDKSHVTVSLALRGNKRISDRTREQICKVAKELGYRPSYAGRALKAGKTHSIGLILPDILNAHYCEHYANIDRYCNERNYGLVTKQYALDSDMEKRCFKEMLDRRCDGIIAFVPQFHPLKEMVEEFWDSRLPFVIIGIPTDLDSDKIDGVQLDDTGVDLAVKHLVELGHSEIFVLGSFPRDFSDEAVTCGYGKAFAGNNLEWYSDRLYAQFSGDQILDGYEGAGKLLAKHPEATTIICTTTNVAIGCMRRFKEMGIRVPEDISLLVNDNTWVSENWPVSLTGVDMKIEELDRRAVDLLFNRLKSDEWNESIRVTVKSGLVVRESTGPVRKLK